METSVTEREAGAITEPEGQKPPIEEVKTPVDGKVSSETPKTRTDKELRDAVKAAEGRAAKQLQEQANEHKSQLEQVKQEAQEAIATLDETRATIADLEGQLEALDDGSIDSAGVLKLKKELRAEKTKLAADAKLEKDAIAELRKAAEAEREEWAGTVAEAQAFKFDGELTRLVDEYGGDVTANFTNLKTVCEKAGIKTKEGAEAIAETFLTKKVEEPDLLEDSGVTRGGGINTESMTPRELIAYGLKTGK